MIRPIFYSIIFLLFFSCSGDEQPRTEVLEIYKSQSDGEGYVQGPLTHYENRNYRGDQHMETLFFNPAGELKGKEVFLYDEGKKSLPHKSEYYQQDDYLMSYYEFSYNEAGEKVVTKSYEGSTDKLLRIERFYYADKNMVRKEIRNASDAIQRAYDFTHDGDGNETGMYITNAIGDTIAIEKYDIISYYDDKSWKERWGFSNDKPSTYSLYKK